MMTRMLSPSFSLLWARNRRLLRVTRPSWNSRVAPASTSAVSFSSASSSSSFLERTASLPYVDSTTRIYHYWSDNEYQRPSSSSSALSSSSETTTAIRNPATQELIGHVVAMDPVQEWPVLLQRSITAGTTWRRVPVQQRQRVMLRLQHLIRQETSALVDAITLENGKTLADAHGDVFRGLEVVETACQVATHMQGDSLWGLASHLDTVSYRVPLGVCAGIAPFNFPAMIPLWMFPLAVACGNTFILKPSERTPGAALLLAQLAAEAGLPPNVLQVVHGSVGTVETLCQDPIVQALSFVGGNTAGERVVELGTAHGARVQSNMGAKNHAVVLPDVTDRAAVVQAMVGAAFGAAGQRCMALSTLIVVDPSCSNDNNGDGEFATELIHDICQAASRLNVGPGWHEGTDVGPLITPQARERVLAILNETEKSLNAKILLDGRALKVPNFEQGNFLGPTVVQVSSTDPAAYRHEIFGPVLTILVAPTLQAAVEIINANPYGNGCALFTASGGAARYFIDTVECGQMGVNVPVPVPLPMFSFTGNKRSMRGDLNFYGKSGVQFFTQYKTVTSHWPLDDTRHDLGGVVMPTVGAAAPHK